jgi:hypothetical protein
MDSILARRLRLSISDVRSRWSIIPDEQKFASKNVNKEKEGKIFIKLRGWNDRISSSSQQANNNPKKRKLETSPEEDDEEVTIPIPQSKRRKNLSTQSRKPIHTRSTRSSDPHPNLTAILPLLATYPHTYRGTSAGGVADDEFPTTEEGAAEAWDAYLKNWGRPGQTMEK